MHVYTLNTVNITCVYLGIQVYVKKSNQDVEEFDEVEGEEAE